MTFAVTSVLAIAITSVLAACDSTEATRAVVEIYSDIADEIATVRVEIADEHGSGRANVEHFAVPDMRDDTFLFSFAVAPSRGRQDASFLLTITGVDGSGDDRVQQRAVGTFVPGSRQHLKIWLTKACLDRICANPAETCSDENVRRRGDACVRIAAVDSASSVDAGTTSSKDGSVLPTDSDDASAMDATSQVQEPREPGSPDSSAGPLDATRDESTRDSGTLVDPCQGVSGCTACGSDGDCPDPGACWTTHCNVSRGACESAPSDPQSSCGSSTCDGEGHCVGCLVDEDCGEPGSCKAKHCNATTHVCEPKSLPVGEACTRAGGGAGVCSSGNGCVQCNAPTDCKDAINQCQERLCNNGICGIRAKTGSPCSTGFCSSSGQCAECAVSDTCPSARPYCVDDACKECTADADCGNTTRKCLNNSCVNRCGDKIIDRTAGEDCEVGVGGWTSATCNIVCKQGVYVANGGSFLSAKSSCSHEGDDDPIFGPGDCPSTPSFTATCLVISPLGCFLSCNTDANCPSGSTCEPIPGVGSAFNPPFAGLCK